MCSQFCRKLWPHLRLNKQANGSHGDFDNSLSDGARNWFTMLLQAFDVALNGVTYIHHCFVTSFPLRDAARQSRAFSDKYAVFVWFNRDAKFHVASLPSRNGSQCDSLRLTQPPYSGASFIHRKRLTIQRNHNVRSTSARPGVTRYDYLAIDEKVRHSAL